MTKTGHGKNFSHPTHARRIPTVMRLSGGYTRERYRLVARTVARVVKNAAPE